MTAIQLYDTAARKKRDFVPQDPGRVTMYVCGPTVYSTAHIGNFRPAITFDVLYRLLRHEYGAEHVAYARNITDVDDKINAAAAEEGVDISVITERFATIYREDSAALNILAPTIEPAATAHMDQMIALMGELVENGFAYAAEGHVLFDVTAYEQYGALSKRSLDDMIAGARVEVAPYKKNPADFVLWKPSTPGEPVWDSPFGPGRPGWHLECSAMIEATLGQTIDIHGGGADLVFPHHENEIAQSACAHGGAPLAHYWLHNGFLSIESEKMSKSLGNIVKPHELLERGVKGEVIRYAMLTGHYRAPLDWTPKLIERAQKSLDRLYGVLRRFGGQAKSGNAPEPVLKALRDDLNTPKALAALFELAGRANKAESDAERAQAVGELKAAGDLLGLLQEDADAWFGLDALSEQRKRRIDRLLERRAAARKQKDFATADELRSRLSQSGIQAEDAPEGTTWRFEAGISELVGKTADRIVSDAHELIESYQLLKASWDRVDADDYDSTYAAHGLAWLRRSLERQCIAIVYRIWDRTSDANSIPNLIGYLRRYFIPIVTEYRDRSLSSVAGRIDELDVDDDFKARLKRNHAGERLSEKVRSIRRLNSFVAKKGRVSTLIRLNNFRNKHVGHSLEITREEKRLSKSGEAIKPLTYEDLDFLYEETIRAATLASLAAKDTQPSFGDFEKIGWSYSVAFWAGAKPLDKASEEDLLSNELGRGNRGIAGLFTSDDPDRFTDD